MTSTPAFQNGCPSSSLEKRLHFLALLSDACLLAPQLSPIATNTVVGQPSLPASFWPHLIDDRPLSELATHASSTLGMASEINGGLGVFGQEDFTRAEREVMPRVQRE